MSGHVVVATGFNREAATVRRTGVIPVAGGGDANALRTRIEAAVAGAAGIMSYGMAGALVDGLAVGEWVVGERVCGAIDLPCDPAWRDALLARLPNAWLGPVFADGRLIDTVAGKLALGERHGALIVDMESHVAATVAAERGLPFAVLRCVSDGARHLLPPAIAVSMRPDGGIDLPAMMRSFTGNPGQVGDVVRSIRLFGKALAELKSGAARVGSRMALPA